MVSLLLIMLPTAMADMQIIQGPSAMASSNGALALGGKLLVTDPTGDAKDGAYFALMGLNALAVVPNDVEGYAYANMVNQGDSFSKSIDLYPWDAHGDTVRFDMSYTGSVSANVEKTRIDPANDDTAIAYAGIGGGVADVILPVFPGQTDVFDAAIGGAGMLAALSLPQWSVGNAGASGNAMYNIEKIGDTVMGPTGLASDEVLRTYGSVIGEATIAGDGQLINGAAAARNNVLGLATLGTASLATDNAFPIAGEGAALSASGMGTLTAAFSGADEPHHPEFNDASIVANVAGEAVSGAWDGSTPIGTPQIKGSTDNVRTVTSGSANSVAKTYLNNDFAGSLSLLGNLAFHSSPIVLPAEMCGILKQSTVPEEVAGVIATGETEFTGIPSTMKAEEILISGGKMDEVDAFGQFEPVIEFRNEQDEVVDPLVAANIAVTGAVANRANMGTFTSPILTAEAFINDANSDALAKMGDRSSIASLDNFNMGSGAHLRSHVDTVGSLGLAVQGAGQAWDPLLGSPELKANVGIYGALTAGPTADGDRWDDAGTLMKFDKGVMEASKGTTPTSAYMRTTNGPLDEITWIEGSDFNPRIYGQNYNSLFEDNTAGSIVQLTGKVDGLAYLENQVILPGRNTLWLSATIHGGIQ
jgi:hypothetical protein